jgi:hypothetical protein
MEVNQPLKYGIHKVKIKVNVTLRIHLSEKIYFFYLLGATWPIATPFYTEPGAFVRNRIIPTLDKYGLIFPCYNSSPDIDNPFILRLSSPTSQLIRVDIKDSDNLVQPSTIRLNNSAQLRTYLRDESAEWIYYIDSNDDGLTWTTPKPISLPNNNAGIESYTLKSGAILMAFNNHSGKHKPRAPLTVALSYDNGMSWPYQKDVQIHDDDNITFISEYSYPSLLQLFQVKLMIMIFIWCTHIREKQSNMLDLLKNGLNKDNDLTTLEHTKIYLVF